MRALVVTLSSHPETSDPVRLAVCFASLDALGITWGRALVEVMPSTTAINTYDFIVIPNLTLGYSAIFDNPVITIPVIGLYTNAYSSALGATPGITGAPASRSDNWLDVPYTKSSFIAAYGYTNTLSTGKALATVSATEPNEGSFTGVAQTNAGRVMAWRTETAGGGYLYCSGHDPANHGYLPFLLQEAINDKKVSPAPRLAPLCLDLDHINGIYAHNDPTIIDKIASYIPAGGMIWCGVFNASLLLFQNMSPAVQDKLKFYSGNKFKYCWHNHKAPVSAGVFPNVIELVNKQTQGVNYQADQAVFNGLGLEFHQPGYYNSGSNEWTESTMELFSGDTSITADGNTTATKSGYGFTIFRCIRASTRAAPVRQELKFNQHAYKHSAHGIQIFNTWDMAYGSEPFPDLQMPYNTIINWRANFSWVCNAINFGQTLYMHDEDFSTVPSQSPGIGQHGWTQAQIISEMGIYMKDTIRAFADATDYVPQNYISMA